MDTEIFTVFDSAAARFLEPFFAPTIEVALRMFREVVNKEGHDFNRFPEDYTLFHIGAFSAQDGQIIAQSPRSLGVALTFTAQGPALQGDLMTDQEVADAS